jgi:hypothetical protein
LRERKAAGYLDRLLGQREGDAAATPPKRLSWPVTRITREPGNALTTAAGGNLAAPRHVSGRAVASDRPAGAAPSTARSGDRDPHWTPKRGPRTVVEPGHGGPPATLKSDREDADAAPTAARGPRTVRDPGHDGPPAMPESGHGKSAAAPTPEPQWPLVMPVRVAASRARPAETNPADMSAAPDPLPADEPISDTLAWDDHPASGRAPDGGRRRADPSGEAAALSQVRRTGPAAGTPSAHDGPTQVKPGTVGQFAGRLPSAARSGTASGQTARIEIGVLEVRVSAPPGVPPSPGSAGDPVPAAPRPERLSRGSYPFGLRQG